MNGLLGRNTKVLEQPLAFSGAERLYAGHYLLVFEPAYDGQMRVVGGMVAAVSKTEAGIQRAIQALSPIRGRFRVVRLFA